MNDRSKSWLPAITLVLLALASGVAWRAELELRSGWAGLAWIGYYHWAVPMGALAFYVWTVCVARVRRRAAFALSLLVFAVGAYCAVDHLVHLYFTDRLKLWLFMKYLGDGDLDRGMMIFVAWSEWVVPLLWASIPLAFCVLCRAFGAPISLWMALLSATLFVTSWPLAILVRGSFQTLYSQDDPIHALKSGYVVPFLVISLGLPLLPAFLRRLHSERPGT